MKDDGWPSPDGLPEPPVGDPLEGVLSDGPSGFPKWLAHYPAMSEVNRVYVLLGGLGLGPAAEEAVRVHLSSRDSRDKWAFMVGLGYVGHPEAEGYFTRVLREKPHVEAMGTALRCIGRIRGRKAFPLLVEALGNSFLFAPACDALAAYGGAQAAGALLPRASELPAFRALAAMGAKEARDLFVQGLQKEGEWKTEAARGICRLGDPSLGTALLPLFQDKSSAVTKAALQAYASLGAPGGVTPLLEAASQDLPNWLAAALCDVEHPEVHRMLAQSLSEDASGGFWKKLFSKKRRKVSAERRTIFRGLRGATEASAVERLLRALREERDPYILREILSNAALQGHPEFASAAMDVWHRDDLLSRHLAARALLRTPTASFLSEALDYLGKPGFLQMDKESSYADVNRVLTAYAQDSNPCVFLRAFLECGVVDLSALHTALRGRLSAWDFPSERPPAQGFVAMDPTGIAPFLEAFLAAHPGKKEALARIWNLLGQLEEGEDRLLDFFLSAIGTHRGGIQWALFQGMPDALARVIHDKTDTYLPELEALASRIPLEGPTRVPLRDLFDKGRRELMAKCRDMALFSEGRPKSDMVIIAKL